MVMTVAIAVIVMATHHVIKRQVIVTVQIPGGQEFSVNQVRKKRKSLVVQPSL